MSRERRLLNVGEAALYLGLGKQTLYNMVSRKAIRCVKLGKSLRFDIGDLDMLIANSKIETGSI